MFFPLKPLLLFSIPYSLIQYYYFQRQPTYLELKYYSINNK